MNMKKNIGLLIGSGVALIATVAIGIGIKTLWESRSGTEPVGRTLSRFAATALSSG